MRTAEERARIAELREKCRLGTITQAEYTEVIALTREGRRNAAPKPKVKKVKGAKKSSAPSDLLSDL